MPTKQLRKDLDSLSTVHSNSQKGTVNAEKPFVFGANSFTTAKMVFSVDPSIAMPANTNGSGNVASSTKSDHKAFEIPSKKFHVEKTTSETACGTDTAVMVDKTVSTEKMVFTFNFAEKNKSNADDNEAKAEKPATDTGINMS